MADADEDLIPSLDTSRQSRPSPFSDNDGNASDSGEDSDAAPDYRFLTTSSAKKHALPARGTKDFEPNPTTKQASSLDASRKAMSDALSVVRVHSTRKNEMVGIYFADPEEWDGQKYEQEALAQVEDPEKRKKIRQSSVLKLGEGRCVAVEKFTTTLGRTMGQSDRRNWIWLLPEEALFLIERGSLDIRYAAEDGEAEDQLEAGSEEAGADDSSHGPRLRFSEIPMSLQGAYAAFIGKSGLTLERYIVYANLRRTGYIVQRAPTWHGPLPSNPPDSQADVETSAAEPGRLGTDHTTPPPPPSPSMPSSTPLAYRLLSWLFPTHPKPPTTPCYNSAIGPLISPGLFRSYGDIFRQLHLIPQHNYPSSNPATPAAPNTTALNPLYPTNEPTAIENPDPPPPPNLSHQQTLLPPRLQKNLPPAPALHRRNPRRPQLLRPFLVADRRPVSIDAR